LIEVKIRKKNGLNSGKYKFSQLKKNRMKQKIIIISVFTLLIMSACKTTRQVSKPIVPASNEVVQLIEQVKKVQPEFKTANVSKMSLAFNVNEREINVSAVCKIKKDSAIFVSIQPFLGIEMFKAELMPDSMKVYDKMNHRYYVTDYAFFSKHFGVDVDFYSFQALLSAQFFCVGKKEVVPDSCKLITSASGQNKIEFNSEKMLQNTEISALNRIQQVVLKAKNSDYQLQTDYSDYTVVNGINFPQKIALLATNQKTKATCDFSILRIEFNTDIKLSPTNPDRYSRGDINQLLKK